MKSLQRVPAAVSGRAVAVWMLSIVIVGVTTGCGRTQETDTTGADTSVVRVDGSSTVFPITEAVAEEYQKENSGVRITVGISGTGGGFQRFCRGETDISDASRPIRAAEMETCQKAGIEFIEVPVA